MPAHYALSAWRGQLDVVNGKLIFFGIGRLNVGSNVVFECQSPSFNFEIPPAVNPPRASAQTGAETRGSFQTEEFAAQEQPDAESHIARLVALLQELQTSGKIDPALGEQIALLCNDPRQLAALVGNPQLMEALGKQLEDSGANDVGSGPPLDISDYYREAPDKYELKWPLDPSLPLQMPFDRLDRKTQFYVLFGEWSRREMQGMSALHSGQVDTAQGIFQECLERAEQLGVAELKARSYEGFIRVAQKRGDRQAERQWSQAAQQARLR